MFVAKYIAIRDTAGGERAGSIAVRGGGPLVDWLYTQFVGPVGLEPTTYGLKEPAF